MSLVGYFVPDSLDPAGTLHALGQGPSASNLKKAGGCPNLGMTLAKIALDVKDINTASESKGTSKTTRDRGSE